MAQFYSLALGELNRFCHVILTQLEAEQIEIAVDCPYSSRHITTEMRLLCRCLATSIYAVIYKNRPQPLPFPYFQRTPKTTY
jgi:hypothetical protein